jgi:hypothetical protein
MPDSYKPPDVFVAGVVVFLLALGIVFAVLGLTPMVTAGLR